MESRRLVPLGVAVAALVVLAGVASRGRPLAGSGGGAGPTATFFDYFFTTFLIASLVFVAVTVWGLLAIRPSSGARRGRSHLVSYLLSVAAGAVIALLVMHNTHFLQRFRELDEKANKQHQTGGARRFPPPPSSVRAARIRWDEIAIVVALVAGATFFVVAGRSRKRMRPPSWRSASRHAASVALDESLDDLRNEPDLRRAIIAAYARMETALAAAGLPRRPSEAPLEYLERALTSLDTSSEGVRRLTVLFEWAKFSQHEPEPAMRDEAIDALVAVRDELRAPVEAEAV